MIGPTDPMTSEGFATASWEDDGGMTSVKPRPRDLNELLASEQQSIMIAEAASTPADYETHRTASRRTRRSANALSYPEHMPHVFAQESPTGFVEDAKNFAALVRAMEQNEERLSGRFADGEISPNRLVHLQRCLRQERANLFADDPCGATGVMP